MNELMKRREFMTLLGGAAVAWPLAARAQQSAMPLIGVLGGGSPAAGAHLAARLRQGLADGGSVEGRSRKSRMQSGGNTIPRMPSGSTRCGCGRPDLSRLPRTRFLPTEQTGASSTSSNAS